MAISADLGERLDVAFCDGIEARLNVEAALLEIPDRLADQCLVLEHHLVCIENQRLLLTQIFSDLLLHLRNLAARHEQRLLEARDLRIPLVRLHRVARYFQLALQVEEHLPVRDALRRRNPLDNYFAIRAWIHGCVGRRSGQMD